MAEILQTWVPDGDPCPKHPTEISRLIHIPGVGYFSQCPTKCIDEFFEWYGSQKPAERRIELHPRKRSNQESLAL